METMEKKLNSYKGIEIYKVYDITSTGKKINVVYMANDNEGNNINCLDNLKDLKKWIDNYTK